MTSTVIRRFVCTTILFMGALLYVGVASFSPKTTVQAQTGTHHVYLPLVLKNFPPISDTSYYMGSTSYADVESIATAFANKVLANPSQTDHLVVLDFCTPGTSGGVQGAYMCRGKGWLSAQYAGALATDFAITWKIATDNTLHRIWIAIGENNAGNLTVENAQAWAQARLFARTSVIDNLRVFIVGATDAETSFGSRAQTRAWVDAYMAANHGCTPGTTDGIYGCLYDFGDANCGYDPLNVACDSGSDWLKDDIWYFSAGAKRTGDQVPFVSALPEIYNTLGNNARQWQSVSLYGATTSGKWKVFFAGSLTQQGACAQVGGCSGIDNPASEGYAQLYNWLNSDSRTAQSILWSTDILYQNP